MRQSAETQAKYTAAESSVDTDWMMVTDRSRRELLKEHGLPATEPSIRALQRAALAYPTIPLYVRYNRCRQGELAVGDRVPDVPLIEVKRADGGTIESGCEGEGKGKGPGKGDRSCVADAGGGGDGRGSAVGAQRSLHDLCRPGVPLVLFAGSFS